MLAFSRSRKPSLPILWEQDTSYPGPSSETRTDSASSSCFGFDGEFMPITTMLLIDVDLIMAACCLSCSCLNARMSLPSTSSIRLYSNRQLGSGQLSYDATHLDSHHLHSHNVLPSRYEDLLENALRSAHVSDCRFSRLIKLRTEWRRPLGIRSTQPDHSYLVKLASILLENRIDELLHSVVSTVPRREFKSRHLPLYQS